MEMNYKEKVEELEKNQKEINQEREELEWFNPDAKQYKVKILELANEYQAFFDNQQITKKRIVIEVEGKKKNWGITIGKTTASLYGQLMKAGKNMGNLEGNEITLIVKSDGKKRDYTIMEAIASSSSINIVDGGLVE